MKVLITGANGMLGKDLCPALEDIGCFVIPTDYDTLDITDENLTMETIKKIHPDLIIHCAAYTNVDKAEEEAEKAHLINATGTENVAKAASSTGATMVYVSTDYVFDGTKNSPYKPDDKTNPINVYGKTKLQGEIAVQKYVKKHYIARTSWLYGIHGKNFVETMISLANKEELKVVDDQKGCPTWTMELVQGIIKLLEKPYGIYHICGSNNTTWYGFSKAIFEKTNLKVNLKPCTTDEFPRPAKRPKYSVMDNNGIARDWQIALDDYLKLRSRK